MIRDLLQSWRGLRQRPGFFGAALATPEEAALLEVPPGSAVLRCERTTSTDGGRPVLLSQHVFPAHRTEFVVDLPVSEPSIAPSGLRLVD